ncbi:hypothetical protein V5O39_10715 [Pseudomonas parakoreensis]
MERLEKVVYTPSIRSGQYDLLAIGEVEESRRPFLTPLISARGENLRMIESFADEWQNNHFWLDSSRFAQDSQTALSAKLNDPAIIFRRNLEYISS